MIIILKEFVLYSGFIARISLFTENTLFNIFDDGKKTFKKLYSLVISMSKGRLLCILLTRANIFAEILLLTMHLLLVIEKG